MDVQATAKILGLMSEIPDFRKPQRQHILSEIITIAIFAVICGADGWVEVEEYGKKKFDWLKTFLELPKGIPSHDTFDRVFARLKPEEFEKCFMAWMSGIVELSGGKLVAIDGKSLRRSFEHGWNKCGMAHMVSAFVAENKMVFAQVKTVGKGHKMARENIIWRHEGPKPDFYQYEHDLLLDAIRNNKAYNEADRCAKAAMVGILGRMAAECGQMLTWNQALASNIELAPGLENITSLDAPAPVNPDANGKYPVAMPGITKVV